MELAEIGESAWITLAVFVSCVMYYQAVFGTSKLNVFWLVLSLAILPVVVVLLVRMKVIAFSQIFTHPSHYYVMIEDGCVFSGRQCV